MAREIVLDTETTGLDPRTGHRLVEVGCIELEDFTPTGRHFHKYVDPEREMDADAERVHGLSTVFLRGKPKFYDLCDELLEFIGDAVVIAHNAAFDRNFVNFELERANRPIIVETQWLCTHVLAQKRFPGMHNSLDALCKRFRISLAEREKHGALIDAKLLAAVYLELRGGRERALDFGAGVRRGGEMVQPATTRPAYGARPRPLQPLSTAEDRAVHAAWVERTLGDKHLWGAFDVAA